MSVSREIELPGGDEWDASDEGYAELQRGIITEEEYLAGCRELDAKRATSIAEGCDRDR